MAKTERAGILRFLFLMVVSLIFCMAAVGLFSPQRAWAELGEPFHSKTVSDNGDGTYTIALDVTGDSETFAKHVPVDVVLVLDASGSMDDEKRLDNVKKASKALIGQLLTSDNAKLSEDQQVRVSVVSFNSNASLEQEFTSDEKRAEKALKGIKAKGGTNWEDALDMANQLTTGRAGAKKYIVFLSDGAPTYRNSPQGASQDDEEDGPSKHDGVWGNGKNDPYDRNLTAAVDEANRRNGAILYSVYASADAENAMADFADKTSATSLDGMDLDALETSFAQIASEITDSAFYQDVAITDTLSPYVDGTAQDGIDQSSIRYWITANGNKVEWAGAPQAVVNGGDISWKPSDGCIDEELVEGTTYSVSFTVVPNQAAYEYAAEHNGIVPTNASASVSYKAVRKINGEVNDIKDGSADYNMPTIELPVSTLTVSKVWADGSDRHASDSVTVNVTDDQGKFSKQVTLSGSNNWTQTLAVAAGPNGHSYTVEEIAVPGYTATYENQTVELKGTSAQSGSATITNSRSQGNLILTKFVAGSASNPGEHFTFQLSCASLANQSKPVSVEPEDGHPAQITFDALGNASLQLKHGEVAAIGELDEGAQVQVREANLAGSANSNVRVATDAAKANFGSALSLTDEGAAGKVTAWVLADAIPNNGNSYVTFRNTAEIAPDAGVSSNALPMAGLLALAGAGALALVASRVAVRRKSGDVWKG